MRGTLSALASALLGACSETATAPPVDAGPEVTAPRDGGAVTLYLSPPSGYEGQRRFVAQLSPAFMGDDLRDATITPEDPNAGIVIDERACTRERCVIVAHLEDRTPNRGAPIPAAMEGRRVRIATRGRLYLYSSVMTVFPLDAADATASAAGRLPNRAVFSSMEVPEGRTLRPVDATEPVRILVLGNVALHGRIDLSPDGAGMATGGGGFGGVMPGGRGGNDGGHGSAAGGGGGHAEAGGPGLDALGNPSGAGGAARGTSWVQPLLGGAGGGGSPTGVGGAGGGAMLLVGFGLMNLEGASFTALGGRGTGGGGGGSGGAVLLSAERIAGRASVDVSGGAGGSGGGVRGGSGSPGRVRVDGPSMGVTVVGAMLHQGPAFEVETIPSIVRSPMVTLRGTGRPGTRVRVTDELSDRHPTATTTVGEDGRWTAMVVLPPEGNPARFSLVELQADGSGSYPSFSGTTFLSHVEGRELVFDSGALDLVYLPMTN